MVGTFGTRGTRLRLLTPSARTLFACTCGRPVATSVIIIVIWPPRRSVTACGLLLYGTLSNCAPAICWKSSPAMRDDELPHPKLTLPGFAFAYAMSSCTDFAGTL